MPRLSLDRRSFLPQDGTAGTLVGRVWRPGIGPVPVVFRDSGVHDLSALFPTMSDLVDAPDAAQRVRSAQAPRIAELDALLRDSCTPPAGEPGRPVLLAPCDLQVIKAAGVTFATSLLERVIEEQARGDASQAATVRARVVEAVGSDLSAVKPGSAQAAQLKAVLIEHGLWSQYLEVGIGPDAEVFTKAPLLSAVGAGAEIGIHPMSTWNNPEPEVVLAVDSRGRIAGATLGNDVNLRDVEGRSALLLGKAKDNNGSCAIGPFIRLFDDTFTLDDLRRATVRLRVEGPEGYVLEGHSSMAQISRDPEDLVAQAMGANHQYPDGMVLFLGTMFAPTDDRDHPGGGFTHKVGDVVDISSELLGTLRNVVNTSDRVPPWTFGVRALMRSVAARRAAG
jgi:fumarylacetoacetate (FAA) hydrolase family protein